MAKVSRSTPKRQVKNKPRKAVPVKRKMAVALPSTEKQDIQPKASVPRKVSVPKKVVTEKANGKTIINYNTYNTTINQPTNNISKKTDNSLTQVKNSNNVMNAYRNITNRILSVNKTLNTARKEVTNHTNVTNDKSIHTNATQNLRSTSTSNLAVINKPTTIVEKAKILAKHHATNFLIPKPVRHIMAAKKAVSERIGALKEKRAEKKQPVIKNTPKTERERPKNEANGEIIKSMEKHLSELVHQLDAHDRKIEGLLQKSLMPSIDRLQKSLDTKPAQEKAKTITNQSPQTGFMNGKAASSVGAR